MAHSLVGRKILSVDVRFAGRLNVSAREFTRRIEGAKIASAGRRAKLLLLGFSNGETLVAHLKMTGKFLLVPKDAAPTKHTHVVFGLSGGRKLFFEDIRKFGYLKLIKTAQLEKDIFDKEGYGPEPLEPAFTAKRFIMCVRGLGPKRIKPMLMDQTCIAGIGNIYADEGCWRAKIRPDARIADLSDSDLARLHKSVIMALKDSLAHRGTSADNYVDLHGSKGENVPRLKVYGREGQPCKRCGTRIKKTRLAGRGTHYCPKCQGLPQHRPVNRTQRGFTLIEVLTTITIIGLLSTIGTVSYESVRANARDVKRASDAKQIQTAIEFYFENHSAYPDDKQAGNVGLVLGLPDTKTLSDAGFSATPQGTVYMAAVPQNPEPGGSPYVYRSLDKSGANCDSGSCGSYAVLFTLERAQGNYAAGPHALTPAGSVGAEGGTGVAGLTQAGGAYIGIEGNAFQRGATVATDAVAGFVQDPRVQTAAEVAVAPAATAIAVANTAFSTSSFAGYLVLFFTQPFTFFFGRKRKAWGTVYNPLSRLGEDLVIVRLRDAASGVILRSTVTDKEGRFSFLVKQGRYRVEAVKYGFVFPSALTAGMNDDGPFQDLYHGQEIEVDKHGAIVTPNIPIDPVASSDADEAVRRKFARRRLHRSFSEWTLVIGAFALAIRPSVFVALLFAAQVVAFLLFRRLAAIREPKRWGLVYDQKTRKPVADAIARVFEARFDKLLESQATDARGRYHFRVGGNVYYLTVSKSGYAKTETAPVDLTAHVGPTVIASDLPLAPVAASTERASPGVVSAGAFRDTPPVEAAPASSTLAPAETTPVAPAPPSAPPSVTVQIEVPPPEPVKLPEEPRPDKRRWLNSL